MLLKMEKRDSCLLGRYDASFCRRSGKAGEGESVLSKAGAVSDRAEASARWGEISNKLSWCPLSSVGREGGVEVFSCSLMQFYAMQCNRLIGR